jgi:hypothetical protein
MTCARRPLRAAPKTVSPSAERRVPGPGAEVVGGPADGHLHPAGAVGFEEFGRHGGAGGGLTRARVRLEGLDQGLSAGRTVGVEVVQDDEAGAGCLGCGQGGPLQRGELLRPAVVVGGVEAEVDDVRPGRGAGGERWVGGVSADHSRAGQVGVAAAVDGDDVVAAGDELTDDEAADLAGAEHDVTGHDGLSW